MKRDRGGSDVIYEWPLTSSGGRGKFFSQNFSEGVTLFAPSTCKQHAKQPFAGQNTQQTKFKIESN